LTAEAVSDDLYECMNVRNLKNEVGDTEDNLTLYQQLINHNQSDFISQHELTEYVDRLRNKYGALKEAIRKVARKETNMENIRLSEIDTVDVSKLLDELLNLDGKGKLQYRADIREDLQSYDILRNPTYKNMEPLKIVLDKTKKFSKKKNLQKIDVDDLMDS
jgi:hypothetical protein